MSDVAVVDVYELARRFYEQAKGDTEQARGLYRDHLQDYPAVAAKIMPRLADIAITHLIEGAHVRLNNIVTRAAERAERLAVGEIEVPESHLIAQARAAGLRQETKRKVQGASRLVRIKELGLRLLEYGLPGGQRLRDATKKDLLTAAKTLMSAASDQVADAMWFELVAGKLRGSQTVASAGITWKDLLALKKDAAKRAAALKEV